MQKHPQPRGIADYILQGGKRFFWTNQSPYWLETNRRNNPKTLQ